MGWHHLMNLWLAGLRTWPWLGNYFFVVWDKLIAIILSVSPALLVIGLYLTWPINCRDVLLNWLIRGGYVSQDDLKKAISQWHWERPVSFFQVSGRQIFRPFYQETEFWAILLGDLALSWSNSFSGKIVWKGHSQWQWGRPSSFVQVLRRQSFEPFSREMWLQVDLMVLVARWSWNGHFSVTLGKTILQVSGRQSFKPFSQETEFWSILHRDLALSWCNSFSDKIVLKRPFPSDTGEDSAHLFRSWGDRALSQRDAASS